MALRHGMNRLGVLGFCLVAFGTGLAGSIGGCGDSEGNKNNPIAPGADASQGEGGVVPGQDSAAPDQVTIDIVATSVTVYAGQLAQVIAAQSKASNGASLQFGWVV